MENEQNERVFVSKVFYNVYALSREERAGEEEHHPVSRRPLLLLSTRREFDHG